MRTHTEGPLRRTVYYKKTKADVCMLHSLRTGIALPKIYIRKKQGEGILINTKHAKITKQNMDASCLISAGWYVQSVAWDI